MKCNEKGKEKDNLLLTFNISTPHPHTYPHNATHDDGITKNRSSCVT